MAISRMKFKTISQEKIQQKRGSKPFVTLNHNSIYLPKVVSLIVKNNNYKYAIVRVAQSVISIEFIVSKINGSFEININEDKKTGIIYGLIGSTALSEQIAKEFNIILDKNRYYKSIDSEIRKNIMYFEFDRNQCIFRKGK